MASQTKQFDLDAMADRCGKLERENADLKVQVTELRTALEAATRDGAAAKALLEERAEILARPPTGFIAKTLIVHSGVRIPPGAPLPFDPTDAKRAREEGYDGLEENVHWTRAYVAA